MPQHPPLLLRTMAIFSDATLQRVDSLLLNGWYIAHIEEQGLGYLLFALDAEGSNPDTIGYFNKETANDRVIVVVLQKGERRARQRLIVLDIPEGGTLDTQFIAAFVAKEYPEWRPLLSTRLDAGRSLSLVEEMLDME